MKGVLEFGDKPANKLLVPLPKPGISAALTASQTMTRRQGVNSQSAGYVEPKTRPLIEKLEIMFDFIFPQLKAAWGGKTENDVAERMIQEAKKINGGRELA